jgi:hypothetical protein
MTMAGAEKTMEDGSVELSAKAKPVNMRSRMMLETW